jgi:D-beta-D-heptose 7-phosphate kinase / D-beta-D-heptose 1-phosphate adenosyltransferase
MTTALRNILAAFRHHRVLVLGDVMLDEYVTGDCSRLSPEAPVPVVAVSSSRTVLGGAANTAHNITALGGQAVLVGVSGDDEAGRQLMTQAVQARIDFVPVTSGRPTVRKVRVLGQQQQLLRLDYESRWQLGPEEERRILDAVKLHLPTCASVVVSDYAKGFLTESLCQSVLAAARAVNKPVIVDPRPQHAAFYVGCDFLTPNWKESRGLLGLPDDDATPETISTTGRLLARKFRTRVLLTLGAKGMTFFDRSGEQLFSEPSIAREVFDVSGAGDTVVAAFSLALAVGCSHRDAVALANLAAGLVVAKLGTATVTAGELLGTEDPERTTVSREALAGLAARLRSEGKRIVTINGSFDVLHAGHLHILREARRQGDVLIVGLNSDRSVKSYKGPDRPFVGESDRAAMLLALKDVDYVHIFDDPLPMPFLEEIKPDVHVNGSEYGAECVEAATVRAHGGRIHVVERLPGLSTSGLVARIHASPRP